MFVEISLSGSSHSYSLGFEEGTTSIEHKDNMMDSCNSNMCCGGSGAEVRLGELHQHELLTSGQIIHLLHQYLSPTVYTDRCTITLV